MELEYSETNMKQALLIGLGIGILVTVLLWIIVVQQVEMSKVRNGYLTLQDKTYTVTLYDTLDAPEKEDK